jgi:DNA-binding transcriptional MocR family regulator
VTTYPINPNVFGALGVDGRPRLAALSVLADQELFRYRGDAQPSWNDRLEQALADWSRCPSAVTVNSGTTGLRVALKAAGVSPGDHVLVSAYTFVASAMAVAALGAIPEPLDTDDVLGVDLDDLAARLTEGPGRVVHVQASSARAPSGSPAAGDRGRRGRRQRWRRRSDGPREAWET